MNKREAMTLARFAAAEVIASAIAEGWPLYSEGESYVGLIDVDGRPTADGRRVGIALRQIIDRLRGRERGGG